MDLFALGQKLLGLGLPVLGNALFGPLGSAAATVIAKALGAPTSTADSINSTLSTTDADVAIQKLKSAEAEWIATVQSQTELGRTQLQQVGETIRAEVQAVIGLQESRLGRFIGFLQLSWRPIWVYQTIVEFIAMDVLAIHELWTGDMQTVNAMMQFSGFLTWYFSIKVAVAGVYAAGRSFEKVNGADNPTSAIMPPWIKSVLDALKAKK